jgi:hypothetical protein
MIDRLVPLVGLSLAFALAVTSLALLTLRLTGRRATLALLVLILLTAFFLGLTHLPLPDPAQMVCPQPGNSPRLQPFRFVARLITALTEPGQRGELLAFGALAALMNLALCAGIGAALGRATGWGWRGALLFGTGLTLGVELTQLTAVWGLWPCPWRQFDVDDLVLNLGGVVAGFASTRQRRISPGGGPGG